MMANTLEKLPFWGRGNLKPKTAIRVARQSVILAVIFGACAVMAYLKPAKEGTASPIDMTIGSGFSKFQMEEALKHMPRAELDAMMSRIGRNNEPRRLTSACVYNDTTCGPTCTADTMCGGKCQSRAQKDEEDALASAVFMLDSANLENADKPQLRFSVAANAYHLCWYIFGIFYMFVALAIVCDEFFVPALECFVDEFQISMDVAGATFMAAGGSMPELATSFISTFNESDVGFAAIVGSAVFNVLFVIAVCALASDEALSLTWWPLARDCTCYLIALISVLFFFGIISPGKIEAWEAVILLFEYISYCALMKVNHNLEAWVKGKLNKGLKGSKVAPESPRSGNSGSIIVSGEGKEDVQPHFLKPSTFRKGIVHLLTQNAYLYETAGIAAVTLIAGDLDETFKNLDKNSDGELSQEEICVLLEKMGVKKDESSLRTAMRRINRTGEDTVSFEAFKRWYLASEARIEVQIHNVFADLDKDASGFIEREEISSLLVKMGHKVTEEEIDNIVKDLCSASADKSEKLSVDHSQTSKSEKSEKSDKSGSDHSNEKAEAREKGETTKKDEAPKIGLEEFEAWYMQSLFFQKRHKNNELEADADENGALTIDMPADGSKSAIAWWAFTYPLTAAMYCTLPDVRAEKYQRNWRIAVTEFVLCLFWIFCFSNVLYECLIVTCNTLALFPPEVAGVTLLAAGTSVPDLLSSYIVAKKGEGDMAVSSSIGSNIFDVTVGLPLPWLSYCLVQAIQGKDDIGVTVSAQSLGTSLSCLILMLLFVVGSIMACKWKLTKKLGWCMLCFYVLFLVVDLGQQLPDSDRAPLKALRF